MSRNHFTEEQIGDLAKNPYVKNVTSKSITYTEEFREYFVSEYESGKLPTEILREAGFDTKVLGARRIGTLTHRFKMMSKREKGFSDTRKGNSGRPSTKELTSEEQIARLQQQIRYLKQENEFLKKINFLNKEAHWKYKRNQKKNSK